jgi:hypothetical protein
MTGVLIKMGNLDTDMHTGKTPHENEDWDWDDVSMSQRFPANHQKNLGEACNRLNQGPSEKATPTPPSSQFQPPEP